jgi:hypothetical protein
MYVSIDCITPRLTHMGLEKIPNNHAEHGLPCLDMVKEEGGEGAWVGDVN